ncbi:hypothetical protein BDA96_01G043600 [Sorghum bicolor]|uniref:Uncharacterized protein n=1 Tax=Sorghum bicolor TaxID=4558 RepID=A0A921RWL9_SORBI|nr:hypothetical protein BDA96_01G043600 [Sorghum bicolor]
MHGSYRQVFPAIGCLNELRCQGPAPPTGWGRMSMPLALTVSVVDVVFAVLEAWVSACLSAAAAVARAARTASDRGASRHVSWILSHAPLCVCVLCISLQ